jgi:hypothetical protein
MGIADNGRSVFFTTRFQLVPEDNDSGGDFYDARIGGGMPEAVKPIECEGDACLNLLAAAIDTTPASVSFSGPGEPSPPATKSKPRRKSCRRHEGKQRCRRRHARRHGARKSWGRLDTSSQRGHR